MKFVKNLERGNAVIGGYIHNIIDMKTPTSSVKGSVHTVIDFDDNNSPVYFDNVCNGVYYYVKNNGYKKLGLWIENAAKKHNN